VYLMAMLLWFDVLLLARNRESRNKRMQLGGSLCTGCGYPRMRDVERCAECGFVETEETTKPFRGPAA
jgi:predicted Zn-ribbon and HTH transcriptional regulator